MTKSKEDVKDINALMRYLKEKHNINIEGSSQKRKLKNFGYYHGFKGYRFIKSTNNPIVFSDFNEIIALNKLDMKLKSLFYPKIMFLETALKNYVLEIIINESKTNDFNIIYDDILTDYKIHPIGSKNYKKALNKRLNLRDQIYNSLTREYNMDRKVVQHFYHKDKSVPIWAIFEVITFGNFGTFLSCSNKSIKKSISKELKLNQSCDTRGILTEKIVYLLKDLRNSLAHNSVIFDCRFKTGNIDNSLIKCLEIDMKICNISFDTIVDYVIIITYLLKNMECSKIELEKFISDFEKSINDFRDNVPSNIYSKVFYTDTRNKGAVA